MRRTFELVPHCILPLLLVGVAGGCTGPTEELGVDADAQQGGLCAALPSYRPNDWRLRLRAGELVEHLGERYRANIAISYPNAECAPSRPAPWCASWFTHLGSCEAPSNAPPSVRFLEPVEGQLVGKTLPKVRVESSDADGVASVELFLDGALVRREGEAPYEWGSTTDAALRTLAEGEHELLAVSTDRKNASAVASRTIRVQAKTSCRTVVSEAGFTHPGIVDTCEELDRVKGRIARREAPWTSWHERFANSKARDVPLVVETPWRATPVAAIRQDYNSDSRELAVDSSACIAQALEWAYTGKSAHADNVLAILDAWRRKLVRIDSWRNGRLVAGWHLPKFFRCAEIVKYTYDEYTPTFDASLRTWTRDVLLPVLDRLGHDDNGNWRTSGVEAMLAAAVFLDDRALLTEWEREWRDALTDFILREDGATWESCRDEGHTSYALSGLAYGALTLHNQGRKNVFSHANYRLYRGFEYAATIANGQRPAVLPPLEGRASCHWNLYGPWTWAGTSLLAHYEKYDSAAKLPLTQTRLLTKRRGIEGATMSWGWETLRHGSLLP